MCSFIEGKSYPVFSKDDLTGQLPQLKNKYLNYSDYADQQITDIFTYEELKDAIILETNTLSSSYIENLGDAKFKITPLPTSTQFAPIHSILMNDYNSDGNLDVLMADNFFGTRVKYGRYDSNKGTLLLGNGNGSFEVIETTESGLQINGEVRDIEMITLADGSTLFLFAENNKPIQTYRYNK